MRVCRKDQHGPEQVLDGDARRERTLPPAPHRPLHSTLSPDLQVQLVLATSAVIIFVVLARAFRGRSSARTRPLSASVRMAASAHNRAPPSWPAPLSAARMRDRAFVLNPAVKAGDPRQHQDRRQKRLSACVALEHELQRPNTDTLGFGARLLPRLL
jgi:hypothetical protein